jgi:hypothetical protein
MSVHECEYLLIPKQNLPIGRFCPLRVENFIAYAPDPLFRRSVFL